MDKLCHVWLSSGEDIKKTSIYLNYSFLAFLFNKNEPFPPMNTRIKNWPSGCGGSPQCSFGTLLWCSHCEGHDTSFAQNGILLTPKSLYSKLLIVLVKRKRISFPFWKLNGSFFYTNFNPLIPMDSLCQVWCRLTEWFWSRKVPDYAISLLSVPLEKRDYILTIYPFQTRMRFCQVSLNLEETKMWTVYRETDDGQTRMLVVKGVKNC